MIVVFRRVSQQQFNLSFNVNQTAALQLSLKAEADCQTAKCVHILSLEPDVNLKVIPQTVTFQPLCL